MGIVALALVFCSLALAPSPTDEIPTVPSTLEEVTVYPSYALARRTAELPPGGGVFAVAGIPRTVDVQTLKLELDGGEVVRTEFRDRPIPHPRVPETELETLRGELRTVVRELEEQRSALNAKSLIEEHLGRLLKSAESYRPGESELRPIAEVWSENLSFLLERFEENRRGTLALRWRVEELEAQKAKLEKALADAVPERGESVRELVVDVLALEPGPLRLEIEYGITKAGWQPVYDLRVAEDLSGAQFLYRAKVWQSSSETWEGASIVLSTANPHRGVKAPELVSPLLALDALADGAPVEPPAPKDPKGFSAAPSTEASTGFAEVGVEGVAVRFTLPRRETIPSREAPTNVLVGRAQLAVEAEHYCAPAQDLTVWLRARVKNTSEWVMLPGPAGVHFGRELVGTQPLGIVQVGAEITLHLGPDAGVVASRTLVARDPRGAGFMGKRDALVERWRIAIENLSGKSSRRDGTIDLVLREPVGRTEDERLRIEVEQVEPATSQEELWERERILAGILTWTTSIGAHETKAFEYHSRQSFPTGLKVAVR